jgi:pimeloyl-ACP methyl ester carboxylesterase
MRGFAACVACISLVSVSVAGAQAQAPQLETKSYTIPSGDPGIDLFIRNKHQAGAQQYGPDRILLFVHGATYPAETAFDLPIEGASMMDLFAQQGYDVYLVDVRGYGGSTRPPEMSKPASENKPIVSTEVAAHDLGVAVDHILKTRGVSKIDLMGWSWGTAIAGLYTSEHNDKVNRLVLYAPLWLFRNDTAVLAPAPSAQGAAPQLGAYRLVSKASARDRWLKGVAEDKKAGLIPPGVFEQWADATWATDPESGKQNPPMLRAPNGVLDDINKTFAAGTPLYDPGKIMVPTFLVHAEWDADLPSYQAQEYFTKLTNAPYRRFVELSEGTHTIMLEKNRMQFFREILNFLNEERPLALK